MPDTVNEIDNEALLEELNDLRKENRGLNRKLKEINYLVSSYEQYAVFQKSLYESLKKQKDEQDIYLRLIFSNTPEIVLVLDADLVYVLGTKRTMSDIGIDTDALIGKDFASIFSRVMPDRWVASMQNHIQNVLNSVEPARLANHTATVNGKERSYDVNIVPFTDPSGKVIGAILMMHDETELHEMVLAANSSNRAKTNFLAKISHEIRTPMNAIAGMAELILREQTSGLVREHAYSIKQASANLMAIINDVLDFSKIESGKLELVEAEYMFSSLVNDVISIIKTRLIDKQVFFVTDIDCNIPNRLFGDEIRIRQILLNLLSNAFKYCDKGAIIFRATRESINDGEVTIVFDVIDSGIGIREDDQKKLFDDFVQLGRLANRDVEGTGLGLVITKNLCETMGGGVTLRSRYGEGSTFTARIPQKYVGDEKYAAVNNPKDKSVLIYETRAAYADSIARSLNGLGVDCALVANQSTFLEELNKKCHTHVFVSSFLFDSTEDIIKSLSIDIILILLAEYGEGAINTKTVKTLDMPVHSAIIAKILNGTQGAASPESPLGSVRFVAPNAQILVVDDLITNLRVAEGLMLPYRMQIDVCRSGREAIELVKLHEYDMVFMDHMMPDMDGVEATLKIRKLEGERFQKLPIVALTANAVSGVREMFMQNGFNDFLAKPIEMAKLNAVLETWLPKDKLEPYVETNFEQPPPAFEIHGVDVKSGVYMTGGSEVNYLRVLSAFYRDGAEKIEQLREFCAKGDMKRYGAAAHAVKGASAAIGAAKFSSLAKSLELAAKNEDADYVKRNNDAFVNEFETLLGNISYVVSSNEKNRGKTGSTELMTEQIAKLGCALADFDIESADAILNELQNRTWDAETNEKLEDIANKILMCEYEQARERAEELRRRALSFNSIQT